MKKTFLFLALVAVMTTTSCNSDETETAIYSAGFSEFNMSFGEFAAMEAFVKNNIGLPPNQKFIEVGKGKNSEKAIANADAQAKKTSDPWIAKFKADAAVIDAILKPGSTFRWTVRRKTNPSDPYCDEVVVVNEFKWPMP